MLEDVLTAPHLPPFWSNLVAYGVGGLGMLVLCGVAVWRMRVYQRLAAGARAASQAGGVLREGEAIVAGTVEYDPQQPGTVQVRIRQRGTEDENSGEWSHRWTEVERRVRAHPFYLRRAQGERIRVEPTKQVFLVDAMDGCILVDLRERVRTVTLTPGESVVAKGRLRRDVDGQAPALGYRGTPLGWVLTRTEREPIYLSTEPLEERFLRWQRFHLLWRNALVLALFAAQTVLSLHYARAFAGEVVEAEIVSKRCFGTNGPECGAKHRHEITSRLPWGTLFVAEVNFSSYLRAEPGGSIAVLHVNRAFALYGRRATLHVFVLLVLVGGLATLGLFYAVSIRRAVPWYAAPVIDRGKGRLDPDTGLPDSARAQVARRRRAVEPEA